MRITYNFKRAYVWELPVRFFHWTLVLSMIVLVSTGFIIANPPVFTSTLEPVNVKTFALIRQIHFVFAYILIANVLFRLYWSLVGNQFASWRNFFPYTKKGLKNLVYVLKVDIFLMKDREHKLSNISIGHNYMAAFSYTIMMLFFFLQVITGFAMYSDTSGWWFPQLFRWLAGGTSNIDLRYIHHIFTWVFLAFIVVHVYLVLYHDYLEARGEASAMVSGYKFVRAERIKDSEEDVAVQATEQMWSGKIDENVEKQ